MAEQIEITGALSFWAEVPLKSAEELVEYLTTHATAEPLSAAKIFEQQAAIASGFDDEYVEDEAPAAFTPAEAAYARLIVGEVIQDPRRKGHLINLEPDAQDPYDAEGTIVQIRFPAHLEPPAELRAL